METLAYYRAAFRKDYKQLEELLDRGAKIETKGDMIVSADILVWAAKQGNIELMEKVVNAGGDINKETFDNETALYSAAEHDQYQACKWLITRGAAVHGVSDFFANIFLKAVKHGDLDIELVIAAEKGQFIACKNLIKCGANIKIASSYFSDFLLWATQHGDAPFMEEVVSAGGDINKENINGETPLHRAIEHDQYQACKWLLNRGANVKTASQFYVNIIAMAAQHGDGDLWEIIMNVVGDIDEKNRDGKTALYISVENSQYDGCEWLLGKGAKPNNPDKSGLTPLYCSCKEGSLEIAKLLLRHMADVNSKGCLEVAIEFYHFNIVKLLMNAGCNVNNALNTVTPLMMAAKTSSEEVVDLLIQKDADPDKLDQAGLPALGYALHAGNRNIINHLSGKTSQGLEKCVAVLCQADPESVSQVFVDKILSREETRNLLLKKASFYGANNVLDLVFAKPDQSWSDSMKMEILRNTILSDRPEACNIAYMHCKTTYMENKDKFQRLILSRGRTKILEIFGIDIAKTENNNELLNIIPKTAEFPYYDMLMNKIIPMIEQANSTSGGLVTFDTLIKTLQVDTIHYNLSACPLACKQSATCLRIREVVQLLNEVMKQMSEEHPIFKDVQIIVVGSLKEGTKIGKVDEADITLALSDKFKQHLTFQKKEQRIMIEKYDIEGNKLDLPSELEYFLSKEKVAYDRRFYGYFDEAKYFHTFLLSFYSIVDIGCLSLPPGLSLSTAYTPCQVCKSTESITGQFVRCRHEVTCEDHHVHKRDDPQICGCKNFTSPCITFSKIGLVLHLEFMQEDGSLLNLDIDVCAPSVPFTKMFKLEKDFDGSNTQKRARLEREREKLVGWKTEWDKSEDNREASSEGDDLKRSMRLRFFNFQDVIAEQVRFHHFVLFPYIIYGSACCSTKKELRKCLAPCHSIRKMFMLL